MRGIEFPKVDIPTIEPIFVTQAEHKDLLDKYEKMKERYENSEVSELHKEINELNTILKEADNDIEEYKNRSEQLEKEFKEFMIEANERINKLELERNGYRRQRDALLNGYHAEVMG